MGDEAWVTLLERAPIGMLRLSVDGQVLDANRHASALLGATLPSELIAQPLQLRLAEEDRARFKEELKRVGPAKAGVIEAQLLSGRTVLLQLVPLNSPGWCVFLDDTSTRTRLARELRGSESRQRLLLSRSTDFVFSQDRELRYSFILNPPLSLSADDVVGRRDTELFAPEEALLLESLKRGVLETGAGAERDVALSVKGQKHHYLLNLAPSRDASGKIDGLLGYARDITRERKAEWERERIHRQLLRTQKLESLGVLSSLLAHDFNNLLVSIMGNASLAELDLPAEHPAAISIKKLIEEAQHANSLTREMLSYSGEDAEEIRPVNVSHAIRDIRHLLHASIAKKIQLEMVLADELPSIEADPAQIQQLVMNLVLNSAEAVGARGDGAGVIRVRTASPETLDGGDGDGVLVTGDLVAPGAFVTIEVSDNGNGMDEATRLRIFDPFFSTRGGQGRGLGLAAVRSIVRAHNGAIHISSSLEKGTTVRALFSTAPAAIEDPPPRPEAQLRGDGLILIVDDEPGVRATAGRALVRFGYRVLFAENGRTGIELYRKHGHAIRAVLLDTTMPDLSGAETLAELRKISPRVPVVLSSGFGPQDALRQLASEPNTRFIQKPYSAAMLAEKLRQVLEPAPIQAAD